MDNIIIQVMLGEVLKKYETYKKNSQKYLQQTKQKLQEHLQSKTIQALKIQNHKVSKIHSNQQDIENRLRRNNDLQAQLKVHLGGWVLLYEQLNKALKEAGDVVNYAQYVEEEVRQISCQLQQRMKQEISKNLSAGTQNNEPSRVQEIVNKQGAKNEQTININKHEHEQSNQKLQASQQLSKKQQDILQHTKNKEQQQIVNNHQIEATKNSQTEKNQQKIQHQNRQNKSD